LNRASLRRRLQLRYRDLDKPEFRAVMRVQDEILSALRDHLRGMGFIEFLAPIIGPATDPGIRGAGQASFDYYGSSFKIMSSMILYKQAAVRSFDRVFALSPNIRLEPERTVETGRHLSEFRQLDLEVADASYLDVMAVGEGLVAGVIGRVKNGCAKELDILGRDLETPTVPFRKITHHDTVELLKEKGFGVEQGEEIPWDMESVLSESIGSFFWVTDYPMTARGFYDREDEDRPGLLRDFDLYYPEGYGEAVSGGEREYRYERVVARMRATGEDPAEYRWYLNMLKEGATPSAGFGIGVERLTRYVCGMDYIWDSVPFPKVPGIISP
jgi:asparaginyl-tRNA synthetase